MQNQPMVGVAHVLRRREPHQVVFDFARRLAAAQRNAVGDRKTWVSTASVGSPKATLSTTLAVLRPTPGKASSASRSFGTSPP